MLKDKINKLVNAKYFIPILVIIINTIFFVICNKLFTPKYEQVDDFIINNLISKMDGNYSVYGVQMHPIICGIIILLYKTTININWYTIFLLALQFISFTIIGIVFAKKSRTIGIPLYIGFMFIMYSKMLSYIQYTTVSMLCIASGFVLLMYSIDNIIKISKFNLIISILMILTGCLIRFSTIIIAIPFIAIYFICKLLKEKDLKVLKVLLLIALLILLIYISFNIFYNINPIYKEFLKFHDVRTYLHDYNWMYYEDNKDVFDSVNWSENDRNIFYAYCFGDENVFNTERLEKIKEVALEEQSKGNVFQKALNSFNVFVNEVNDDTYKYIFIVVVLLIIFNNLFIITNNSRERKDKRNDNIKISFVNLNFLVILGMHCLFIYLDRPMFRVIMSIYIIGIAILIYELLEQTQAKKKKILNGICVIFILLVSLLELEQNIIIAQNYSKDNYSVYKEILEYTNSHKENAYLYTLVMRDRFLAYSVYENIPDDTFSNVRPLGDWDTYTQNYYDFKERYNIDSLIKSLYLKDNVYLISGDVIWRENYKEYITIIQKYIKEHYNVEIEFNIVREFKNNIKIYKLQEK